jgi:hypothetical protein
MSEYINFASLGKGFHEHRCSRWLLRVEPVSVNTRRGNAYIAVLRWRGKEALEYGPFDTAAAAMAHLTDLVRKVARPRRVTRSQREAGSHRREDAR